MIDFVEGILYSIEEDSVIVNVHGIGYKIYVARSEVYNSVLNQTCFIYTHQHFREDYMALYGFQETEERRLFRLLLNVSGIGPKGALAMIAQANPNKIIQAIANEDEKTLVKMPGIGKKTAQRIILDLKDKVKDLSLTRYVDEDIQVTHCDNEAYRNTDLREALKNLGYSDFEINKVIHSLTEEINEGLALDELIKKSLQLLMKV